MNLAIYGGIDSSQVKWNSKGSFLNDAHKDLKADYVIANPPFNDNDWSGDLLPALATERWKFGTPPPATRTTPGSSTSSTTSAPAARPASCCPRAPSPPSPPARATSARPSWKRASWTASSTSPPSSSSTPRSARPSLVPQPQPHKGQRRLPQPRRTGSPLHRRPQPGPPHQPSYEGILRRGHPGHRGHLPQLAEALRGGMRILKAFCSSVTDGGPRELSWTTSLTPGHYVGLPDGRGRLRLKRALRGASMRV